MITNIYHIMQFKDNSAYLNFLGCNWRCKGCVRLRGWESHLSPSDIKKLDKIYPEADKPKLKLNLDDVVEILKDNNAKKAYLGGHEPTIDPNIVEILARLKDEGIWLKLVTNGGLLNEKIIDMVDEVTLSIKALDDEIHKTYAGVSNKKTLENFEKFHNCGKIEMESIYIPGLIECEEILKIAEYIAKYNKNLRYRIDKYLSYSLYGRNATEEDVKKCSNKVKNILPNTYTFASMWGDIRMRREREHAKCLYPKID